MKCGALLLCISIGLLPLLSCKSENSQVKTAFQKRELTDDLGRKIALPETVERAVSLAPNLTESIFAVGAGEKLVGVTTFCNYPPEAVEIQKVGDTISPNMETIIALKPQIVFVSTASQIENFTKTLEQQNIAVFITNPNDLEGVLRNLRQLGGIFDTAPQAEKLIADLERRIAAVENSVKDKPRVKVFIQISREPLFTIGEESFLTEIIKRAGGESVTEKVATAYPKLSKETALALDPEALILSDSADNREPNEVFRSSSAVKNKKVFRVDADIISRPAPRIIEALEQIARDLHQ